MTAAQTVPGQFSAEERERLILKHLPQVNLIARRMRCRLPGNVSLDDLVSNGSWVSFPPLTISTHPAPSVENLCRVQNQRWNSGRPAPAGLGPASAAQACEANPSRERCAGATIAALAHGTRDRHGTQRDRRPLSLAAGAPGDQSREAGVEGIRRFRGKRPAPLYFWGPK